MKMAEVRLRCVIEQLRRDSLRVLAESLAWGWQRHEPASRSSRWCQASEGWLGGRDSNPDNVVQSHVSYR